jgi:chemotaxis protein histidine kinase CheA
MGLYVVKQIVEAHDGRLDVYSEPGHGATFKIRLPLVRASAGLLPLASVPSPPISKKENRVT